MKTNKSNYSIVINEDAKLAKSANFNKEISKFSKISRSDSKNKSKYSFDLEKIKYETSLYIKNNLAVFPAHFPLSQTRCTCNQNPCGSIGKHPRTLNGLKNATTDSNTIQDWIKQYHQFNICIATGAISNIFVLDIDPDNGGRKSLKLLELKFGELPITWTSNTGGGGNHLIFRHPGYQVRNRTGFMPGLDIRGDGGYIVAPPSIHKSGKPYEWEIFLHPNEVEISNAPTWLLEEIASEEKTNITFPKKNNLWRTEFSEPLNEGERNHKITRFAGHLLAKGIDPYVVLELLLAFNRSRSNPPLEDDEVYRSILSVAGREIGQRLMRIYEK